MYHSKHIFRVLILVVVVVVGFVLVRTLFIPRSFGKYGHYRADNVLEQMEKPVLHGQSASCETCHADKSEEIHGGKHRTIQCETCHAPLATHVKEGEIVGKMERNKDLSLCLRCHQRLDARPRGFPQIDPEAHLEEVSMEKSPDVCFGCHNPHGPQIGG